MRFVEDKRLGEIALVYGAVLDLVLSQRFVYCRKNATQIPPILRQTAAFGGDSFLLIRVDIPTVSPGI